MGRIGWHPQEEKFLIENYATLTIKELIDGLFKISNKARKRSADSINAKIKRLKAEEKIKEEKTEETIHRSLIQRRS